MELYNFAVTIKDDIEVYDYMYRMIGGMIYAMADSPILSLNFYPVLAELGSVSKRLAKKCKWSPKLYKIISTAAKPMIQKANNAEEIQNWLRTIKDAELGNVLRLFVHQFVTIRRYFFKCHAYWIFKTPRSVF